MRKKIIILFISLFVMSFVYGCQEAYAYNLVGVQVPDNQQIISALGSNYALAFKTNDKFLVIYGSSEFKYFSSMFPGGFILGSSGNPVAIEYSYATGLVTNKNISDYTQDTGARGVNYVLGNFDCYYKDGGYLGSKGNYSSNMKIKHGDKFSFTNTATSLMYSKIQLELLSPTNTVLFITDENGNFVEQINVSLANGKYIDVEIPPQSKRNIYFAFVDPIDIMNNYFTLKYFNFSYITFEKYIPVYKISGGTTVELNGLSIPNTTPFIKTNATTQIFYKYLEDGNQITKAQYINANEPFYFEQNKKLLVKFRHDTTTTISVNSNFNLMNTAERISLLDDSILADEIISNGGSIVEQGAQDSYYQVNRLKVCKITNLIPSSILGGRMLDFYVQGATNSNATVSIYAYEGNVLYKKAEYTLNGTNVGQQFRIYVDIDGYVIVKENSGTTTVRILATYKENEDYKIEFLTDYISDETIEQNYAITNPSPINIGTANDGNVKAVNDNFISALFGGGAWNGGTNTDGTTSDYNLEMSSMKGFISSISEFISVFTEPMKQLFVGIPEIYKLIVFAIGGSVVLLLLGR